MAKQRKLGDRYADGKLKKPTVAEVAEVVMKPALERRAYEAGQMSPFDLPASERGAVIHKLRDPFRGSQIGRLYVQNVISREQREAADRYAEIRKAALPLECEQKPTPTSSGNVMAQGGRSLREDDPERDASKRRRQSDMMAAIRDHAVFNRTAIFTFIELLDRLCVYDLEIVWGTKDAPHANLGNLREVLNVLARHFGIAR